MKIAVGLSGGIDSSAALLRLHGMGHEVVGLTMKATANAEEYGKCCSIREVHDAKKVCQEIGVRHYMVDVRKDFESKIIDYFVEEYTKGRTPNPCLFCNALVKFKKLIEVGLGLGFEHFATGHYAILDRDGEDVILREGWDIVKDQSYFLSQVPSSLLKQCMFPLGKLKKQENIDFLKEKGFSIFNKGESHGICFVKGNDYGSLIEERVGKKIQGGDILSEDGKKLGRHKGLPFYTVGQRRGLNVALGSPAYVRDIDTQKNTIVIGKKPYQDHLIMGQVNWLMNYNFDRGEYLNIKVRHFHKGETGKVSCLGAGKFKIDFKKEVFSITKGQAAVGYLEDQVVFSGIIE